MSWINYLGWKESGCMNRKGMSAVGISAVVYGVIPMLTMFLYAFGMDAIAVAFYRFFLILPIVLLITKMQGISLRLPWKQVFSIFVYAGFFSGSTMMLLNLAYNYISIGTATTLHFLYPVFVILICAFYYHDVIDARMKKILLIVLLGILFFLDKGSKGSMIGIILAMISAVTYAIYLVQLEKRNFAQMNPLVLSFYISLCTCILIFLVNFFTHSIHFMLTLQELSLFVILSLCSITALGMLQYGSRLLGAKYTSLFSLLEPITSIVTGILFLKEEIVAGKLIGCALILFAIMYLALGKAKKEETEKRE